MPNNDAFEDAVMEDLSDHGKEEPPLGYINAPQLHGSLAQQHRESEPSPTGDNHSSQPILATNAFEDAGREDFYTYDR